MNNCPICGRALRNGKDSPLQIEYTEENLAKFNAGEISLAELNETARFFYTREKICPSKSIPELEFKPCPNFGKVVDTIKIYDQ